MKITQESRIFIAGCGGMLGESFYGKLAPVSQVLATDIDLNEPWLSYADVREYEKTSKLIRDFKPEIIINLAALTDMEFCERNPEGAWLTNGLGAENLGLIAAKLDAVYVYISTAGIFDGKQETYTDFDQPNPLSYYAKSKYYGELYACRNVPRHYVVRAGWMMGGGPKKDKKFINKIYKQILSGSRHLNVVRDKAGTPTYTWDFATGIQKLIESDLYGVYNQVCEGPATRYEVAVEFVRLLGLFDVVHVNDVSSDFFREEYFAPRPASEKLVNIKLAARGLNIMRHWRECLREYSSAFTRHFEESKSKK